MLNHHSTSEIIPAPNQPMFFHWAPFTIRTARSDWDQISTFHGHLPGTLKVASVINKSGPFSEVVWHLDAFSQKTQCQRWTTKWVTQCKRMMKRSAPQNADFRLLLTAAFSPESPRKLWEILGQDCRWHPGDGRAADAMFWVKMIHFELRPEYVGLRWIYCPYH